MPQIDFQLMVSAALPKPKKAVQLKISGNLQCEGTNQGKNVVTASMQLQVKSSLPLEGQARLSAKRVIN